MKTQTNYDGKGFSTGLKVKDLLADLEQQFIVNKRTVFERAIRSSNFRSGVFSEFGGFENANRAAGYDLLKDITGVLAQDIDNSFKHGTNNVDKQIDGYRRQGFEPQREPQEIGLQDYAKASFIGGAVSVLSGIISYSIANANRQLTAVTMQVNENSGNLAAEIDRVQDLMFRNGIQGGVNKGGVEMSMASLGELTTRNQTFEATLQAEALRRDEYALSLVQISAHPSSCPLCLPWQSQVVIDDVRQAGKKFGNYELLSTAVAAGFWHYNCRHTTIPYVPGYSNPNLFDYDKASNKETAERYAVEQLQRQNERNIRQYKIREAEALTPEKRAAAQNKVAEWQARQRALKAEAESRGLPFYRQYTREQAGGKTKPNLPRELSYQY